MYIITVMSEKAKGYFGFSFHMVVFQDLTPFFYLSTCFNCLTGKDSLYKI